MIKTAAYSLSQEASGGCVPLKLKNKSRKIWNSENSTDTERGENTVQNDTCVAYIENHHFRIKQEYGEVQGSPRKRNGPKNGYFKTLRWVLYNSCVGMSWW